jgi:hypothetical protein
LEDTWSQVNLPGCPPDKCHPGRFLPGKYIWGLLSSWQVYLLVNVLRANVIRVNVFRIFRKTGFFLILLSYAVISNVNLAHFIDAIFDPIILGKIDLKEITQ